MVMGLVLVHTIIWFKCYLGNLGDDLNKHAVKPPTFQNPLITSFMVTGLD